MEGLDIRPKRRAIKLASPRAIKRAITRVCNMVLNDEIDPKAANTIILGCNSILSSIRLDDQQKKIEELEALIDENIQA